MPILDLSDCHALEGTIRVALGASLPHSWIVPGFGWGYLMSACRSEAQIHL